MFRSICSFVLAASLLGVLTAGCSDSPTAPSPELEGGVVATFDVSGATFKVFITNSVAINRLYSVRNGTLTSQIPNGRIRRGPGAAGHNAPYSWHLDPVDIEIVDASIELCDGAPDYVEENVDEFVDVIGRYCPWGARLVRIDDYR